ncbi:hypothetical protein [Rickettsia endosymbiont of Orchestes rusci]|uniref:hypothetical protein n=1 Tax=Rickettsia endosymbiont of Orchestes rusci TaxID=3066250 RepID=UPI00313B4D16
MDKKLPKNGVILAKGGNPEHYSHPEFISGSINEMLKQVQHDKKSPDSSFRALLHG